MQSMIVNNNQAGKPVFQQTAHSQYPVSMAMNSNFSKEHPSYPDTAVFHQQRHGMSVKTGYRFYPEYCRASFKRAS